MGRGFQTKMQSIMCCVQASNATTLFSSQELYLMILVFWCLKTDQYKVSNKITSKKIIKMIIAAQLSMLLSTKGSSSYFVMRQPEHN
jgi:hypothetical protein